MDTPLNLVKITEPYYQEVESFLSTIDIEDDDTYHLQREDMRNLVRFVQLYRTLRKLIAIPPPRPMESGEVSDFTFEG